MIELETRRAAERVFLAGLYPPRLPEWDLESSLSELASLARAASAKVVGKELQRRRSPDPAHFFGPGKAKIIRQLARDAGANALIVDQDLSPAQSRNLEQTLKMKVLDRTELILDIFASRARTRAAKVQVELAQYQYLLPRLTKMWQHLSRTGGGIGTRGPGETQLETDRRLVRARIGTLKKRLRSLERHRTLVRSRRRDMFRVVLVGYTNAGKSTLMNGLTRTKLPVANMPFVTLDSTTRRLYLGDELSVLLTDTVGFVGRLPHHLVASFHATLEEVVEADLLLVVVDVSTPGIEDRLDVVSRTLESIGAASVERIVVFNKTDLLDDRRRATALLRRYEPCAVSISALNHSGFDDLRQVIRRKTHKETAAAPSSRSSTSIPIAQSA